MRDALARSLLAAATAFPILAISAEPAHSGDPALIAQQQGNAMAAALLREDYLSVAATACSPVLARVGGVLALARQIEVGFQVMQRQGRQLVDMRFGPAAALFDAAATRFALIPYRSVVLIHGGRLSLESFYLGVQNKDADAWCFIDVAALTPAILHDMFPGAPPGLTLPSPIAPLLETAP